MTITLTLSNKKQEIETINHIDDILPINCNSIGSNVGAVTIESENTSIEKEQK